MTDRTSYAARRALGFRVAVILAVLTLVEFAIAIGGPIFQFPLLTVIAVAKAWLIVQHFMHIGQLRGTGH